MRSDKNKAIQFRKEGKSYNWISCKLGVPKSTLSYWLREVVLSEKTRREILKDGQQRSVVALIERNKRQTIAAQDRATMVRMRAIEEVAHFLQSPLFVAGISLYWAEGYKRGAVDSKWKCVDFTNSDAEMIALMMRFFREICQVKEESFRAQLIAHENIRIERAIEFWSKTTSIPKERFNKTFISNKPDKKLRKRKTNILPLGTIHVRIHDVALFFRIIGWIEGIQKNFRNKGL